MNIRGRSRLRDPFALRKADRGGCFRLFVGLCIWAALFGAWLAKL